MRFRLSRERADYLSPSVQEVTPEKVTLTVKDSKDKDAKSRIEEIPAGFVLWSTGIGKCKL